MSKFKFLKKVLIVTVIAGSFAGLIQAADKTNSKGNSVVSENDVIFIGQLAQTNIAEIDGAKVARALHWKLRSTFSGTLLLSKVSKRLEVNDLALLGTI